MKRGSLRKRYINANLPRTAPADLHDEHRLSAAEACPALDVNSPNTMPDSTERMNQWIVILSSIVLVSAVGVLGYVIHDDVVHSAAQTSVSIGAVP